VVREKGASEELINAAIRVTSVIHAIGVVVDSEKAAPTLAAALA
jgi:alkyl hydroperoxide reductase subunit D